MHVKKQTYHKLMKSADEKMQILIWNNGVVINLYSPDILPVYKT